MSRKALAIITFTLAAVTLRAQTTAGTVSGAVTDSTGSRVAGASITITSNKTHETRSITSSASGDYVFPNIAAGDYAMDAQASGFKREHRAAIHVYANQNARVDFSFQLGQVTETIDVKGGVPRPSRPI